MIYYGVGIVFTVDEPNYFNLIVDIIEKDKNETT